MLLCKHSSIIIVFFLWIIFLISPLASNNILTSKTEILEYIQCDQTEPRVIPDFFEKAYEINKAILEKIERDYSEIELSQSQDSKLKDLSKQRSTLFLKKLVDEIELQLDDYLDKYPTDDEIEKEWEVVEDLLISTPQTKKRLQVLRKLWKKYKEDRNWKLFIRNLNEFLSGKGAFKKTPLKPFKKEKLKLITINFIS